MSRFERIRETLGISKLDDWQAVTPESILAIDDVGPQTLNLLRLHLAAKGLTLRGDQTPTYWQSHLAESRVGTVQLSDEDRSIVCPFTVLIDEQEKIPFDFLGITSDADDGKRPLIVEKQYGTIGPTRGDYTIVGVQPGECHVERKSLDDAMSTILGWGERRERFERTLSFLSSCRSSAVVVECSFGELISSAESRGKKTKQENQKILHRQVLAWQTDYTVPWIFCDVRRLAELTTFQILRRYWKKHSKGKT